MASDDADDALEDLDEFELNFPTYRWSRQMAEADALGFAAALARTSADYLEQVAARAAAESNFRVDQETAANEARQQIDTIFKEPEES